jgi:hypothetical protein
VRKHHHREHEVHAHPRRQITQPALTDLGLHQHIVDQFERQVRGQSPRWPGAKTPDAAVMERDTVTVADSDMAELL